MQKIAIWAPSHNLLSSNISSRCPYSMVNFGPLTAEIDWLVWGTPSYFNGYRDAIWDMDSDGAKEPWVGSGSRSPHMKVQFWMWKVVGPGRGQYTQSDSDGAALIWFRCWLHCTRSEWTLSPPCAAAMRPYVTILWPLVALYWLSLAVVYLPVLQCRWGVACEWLTGAGVFAVGVHEWRQSGQVSPADSVAVDTPSCQSLLH